MIHLLLVLLILQGIFIYLLNSKNVFSPSLIVNFAFLISCAVLVSNWSFFGREDISFIAVLVIFMSITVMSIGELIIKSILNRNKHMNNGLGNIEIQQYKLLKVSKIYYIFIIFVALFVTISRSYTVYQLSLSLGNSSGFLNSFTYVRKYVNSGNIVEVGRLITYPAVLVKASSLYFIFIFCHNKILLSKSSYSLLIPAMIYSVYSLTTTARTGVLEIGITFLIIYYVFFVKKHGRVIISNSKIIKSTIILVFIILLIFILAGNIRSLGNDQNTASDIVNYIGSPILVFNRFLYSYELSPFIGYATAPDLVNILYRLGIGSVHLTHADIYPVEEVFFQSRSNLGTWLRSPIQDFTLIGMLMTNFIIGMIYSYITFKLTQTSIRHINPISFIFSCLLFYPLVSAAFANKFTTYFQLETVYMIIILYIVRKLSYTWNNLSKSKILY